MPNQTTSGALSGAASGASAGTAIMPGWGTAIGAIAGGALGAVGGMAGDRAANRARWLRRQYRGAERQVSDLETQANEQAQARLRQLAAERYAGYGTYAGQLAGPQRTAAGQQAGLDAESRLGGAMGGVDMAPVGNRALVGGAASDTAINAQLNPVIDARRAALLQGRIQGGLSRFDTGALNQMQTGSVDISRRAREEAARQNTLASVRSRMLAQAGARYADRGMTTGEQNQQMLSQMGLAGLHVAGGMVGASRSNAAADATRRNAEMQRAADQSELWQMLQGGDRNAGALDLRTMA